jgi:hypothetical protein
LLSLSEIIKNSNMSINSSYQLHINITTSTVGQCRVFTETHKNNESTTIITKMQAFWPTSLLNDSLDVKCDLRTKRRTKTMNDQLWKKMTECEICPTVLSEGTRLSRWDIRRSAASHFVLPTYYNFKSLHIYFACFKINRGFISVIYLVICIKYICSWMFVTICALLNKEQAYFKQCI